MSNNAKITCIRVMRVVEPQGSAFSDLARNLISEDENRTF